MGLDPDAGDPGGERQADPEVLEVGVPDRDDRDPGLAVQAAQAHSGQHQGDGVKT